MPSAILSLQGDFVSIISILSATYVGRRANTPAFNIICFIIPPKVRLSRWPPDRQPYDQYNRSIIATNLFLGGSQLLRPRQEGHCERTIADEFLSR
jgi:hypothetical protein